MAGKATDKAEASRPLAEAKGEQEKRPKALKSIEIRMGESGGHVVSHNFDNSGPGYGYHEAEQHVFGASDGHKLMKHIQKHAHIRGNKVARPVEPSGKEGQTPKPKPAPATDGDEAGE